MERSAKRLQPMLGTMMTDSERVERLTVQANIDRFCIELQDLGGFACLSRRRFRPYDPIAIKAQLEKVAVMLVERSLSW